ncbi:hypothetical protein [Streptomyces sp. NPDC045470]
MSWIVPDGLWEIAEPLAPSSKGKYTAPAATSARAVICEMDAPP